MVCHVLRLRRSLLGPQTHAVFSGHDLNATTMCFGQSHSIRYTAFWKASVHLTFVSAQRAFLTSLLQGSGSNFSSLCHQRCALACLAFEPMAGWCSSELGGMRAFVETDVGPCCCGVPGQMCLHTCRGGGQLTRSQHNITGQTTGLVDQHVALATLETFSSTVYGLFSQC